MNIVFDGLVGNDDIYMDCLNAIVGTERNTMIDLGCHKAAHTPRLGFKDRIYIDILPQVLDYPNEQEYFKQANVLDTPLDKHYDICFGLDLVEHLTVDKGYELLKIMETISEKQILFTPLGEMWVGNSGHPEEHASGWKPEMTPEYASIVFPDYHKAWGFGAWFFWKTINIQQDFERVKNEINQKSWAKLSKSKKP